jgi:hypothetical protein
VSVAYATYHEDPSDPDPDLDWPLVREAAQSIGLDLVEQDWREPCDWSKFDLVLVRSTWNYSDHLDEFLHWAREVSQTTNLINDLGVVEANIDKGYLAKLATAGVETIPTLYLPNDTRNLPNDARNKATTWLTRAGALAVKPNVGAGARLAGRATTAHELDHLIEQIHDAGRIAMIQPYLNAVDTHGEVATVLINGEISHAVKKRPALSAGGHGDGLEQVEISNSLRALCDQVGAGAQRAGLVDDWGSLLYARVDAAPSATSPGGWQLMELELTEPALFFNLHPPAAQEFVTAVAARL